MKRHWALLAAALAFLVALVGASTAYSQFFVTAPVIMASTDLPIGTKLSADTPGIVVRNLPRNAVPRNALQSPKELTGFMARPILNGQMMFREHITPYPPQGRVEVAIDTDHEIIGIATTLPAAVGGALVPGSRVNVYSYCACTERRVTAPGIALAPEPPPQPGMTLGNVEVVDVRSGKGLTLNPEPKDIKPPDEQESQNTANDGRVPAVVLLKVSPADVKAFLTAMERKESFHLTLVGVAKS